MTTEDAVRRLVAQGGEIIPTEEAQAFYGEGGGAWVAVEACGLPLVLNGAIGDAPVRWFYDGMSGTFHSVDAVDDWVAYCANGMLADWDGAA